MRRPRVRHTLHADLARDDLASDGRQQHSVFLRGLSLGALIGAAIAGSTMWDRRRARRERAEETAAPSTGKDAGNA